MILFLINFAIGIDIVRENRFYAEGEIKALLVELIFRVESGSAGIRSAAALLVVDVEIGLLRRHELVVVLRLGQLLCRVVRGVEREVIAAAGDKQSVSGYSRDHVPFRAEMRAVLLRHNIRLEVLADRSVKLADARREILVAVGLVRSIAEIAQVLALLGQHELESEARQEGLIVAYLDVAADTQLAGRENSILDRSLKYHSRQSGSERNVGEYDRFLRVLTFYLVLY